MLVTLSHDATLFHRFDMRLTLRDRHRDTEYTHIDGKR